MQQTTPTRLLKHIRLLELSRMLNQPIELDDFLQKIINYTRELTLSEAGSILLYEEETNLLKFVAAPHSQRQALRLLRVPLQKSIAGQAFTSGKPVIVQDTRQNPLYYQAVDQALEFNTTSVLAVPITFHDHTLGVLEAVNKLGDVHYTEDDVTILESLAVYAAMAIFSSLLLEETQIAYQNLDQLEKMKSDFIAIASHELRTPLGLILGHATFLQESEQDGQKRKQLDVIVRSANRLKKIIEDLSNVELESSGNARLRRDSFTIQELFGEIISTYEGLALQRNLSLHLKAPKQELALQADREKIQVALGNLVKNALTFTLPGGHVLLSAESLPGYAKISVIDDGIGIPEKDLPHIFERFYQVESHFTRRHGGMGLGLAVAKVMVEIHGGQIWAESQEGKGSNFTFLVPLTPNPASGKSKVFES